MTIVDLTITYARNTDTGKRYLILRDINGNLDMSKKRVSGMSARDDGTTYGPIRTLRTDKLIVDSLTRTTTRRARR